jgi:hypothetical protein
MLLIPLPWYLLTNYANSTEILSASERWLVHLGCASLLCTSDNAVIASDADIGAISSSLTISAAS